MHFPLLTYIRLKLLVTILRLATQWKARPILRRDQQLADARYPTVRREQVRIPSRHPGRLIKATLYAPRHPSRGAGKLQPLLVNWHGSGFIVTGLLGTNALFCARVASELGIPVLDADYRKAPEHPFPAAVHDAEDVLRWAAVAADPRFRFDPSRVLVSGFSAGGALALGAASVLRTEVLQPLGGDIVAVVGVYPTTDLVTKPEDKKAPRDGLEPIDTPTMELINECYVPDETIRSDPLVSPITADPGSYPDDVGIFACEGDRLAPEDLELARRLSDGSRRVASEMLLDVGHGFDAGAQEGTVKWERREEMYDMAVKTLKTALGQ